MKKFKTLNDLNSHFMKEIFYRFPNLIHRKSSLYVHTPITITFGNEGLIDLGHTCGTHCLKTLSKNQFYKITMQIQRCFVKVFLFSI